MSARTTRGLLGRHRGAARRRRTAPCGSSGRAARHGRRSRAAPGPAPAWWPCRRRSGEPGRRTRPTGRGRRDPRPTGTAPPPRRRRRPRAAPGGGEVAVERADADPARRAISSARSRAALGEGLAAAATPCRSCGALGALGQRVGAAREACRWCSWMRVVREFTPRQSGGCLRYSFRRHPPLSSGGVLQFITASLPNTTEPDMPSSPLPKRLPPIAAAGWRWSSCAWPSSMIVLD